MDDVLCQFLDFDENGMIKWCCVVFMGGYSVLRIDFYFCKMVEIVKLFGEYGYFIVFGGGFGIMEVVNFGVYLVGYLYKVVDEVFILFSVGFLYIDKLYYVVVLEVLEKFLEGKENLVILIWFYGYEFSNFFVSYIVKYFFNSIWEDIFLVVVFYGIVYVFGSAGIMQEIFMDVV